jgi:chemotaxis protein histidine kinase CheA
LAGATILGDGNVALILDVLGIAKLARRRAPLPTSNVAA